MANVLCYFIGFGTGLVCCYLLMRGQTPTVTRVKDIMCDRMGYHDRPLLRQGPKGPEVICRWCGVHMNTPLDVLYAKATADYEVNA